MLNEVNLEGDWRWAEGWLKSLYRLKKGILLIVELEDERPHKVFLLKCANEPLSSVLTTVGTFMNHFIKASRKDTHDKTSREGVRQLSESSFSSRCNKN